MKIINPVTPDGMAGFDQFGQFVVSYQEDGSEFTISQHVHDVRGMVCPLCNRSWENTSTSIRDQLFWSKVQQLVHYTCWSRFAAAEMRANVIKIISKGEIYKLINARAGSNYELIEMPDQYAKRESFPWFKIMLDVYNQFVIIGHRKRVWEIRFCNLSIATLDALEKTLDYVEHTKGRSDDGSYYVHAYKDEEASEFIKHFVELNAGAVKELAEIAQRRSNFGKR